jgi:uncharacterized phosphosugar-binding protein
MHDVIKYYQATIDRINDSQIDNIALAAKLTADAFEKGNKVFVTGSGHSHTFSEELYGRAGGLAFFVPMLTSELTLVEHPTKSTFVERLPGYAAILFELYGCKKDDVILIASNSGRNAYPVEMALCAKEAGLKVIAVTNVKHSMATSSRHPSKKRLLELADVVIDNCGDLGDAAYYLNGVDAPVGPTSSIANSVIALLYTVEIARLLQARGIEAPVFVSANIDGGFEKNEKYMRQYARLY